MTTPLPTPLPTPLLSPLSEWAALFVGSLADAGITDLVASPGSRSTPFVLAASREPSLRVHDVIDERSAAFFALGLARASTRPVTLLCTSGSAGAHWFPAIVEAAAAFVPLVLLTADRPSDLQSCGAAQTIDQVKLFGDHVRLYLDPGLPDDSLGALRSLRRMAAQAVHVSRHPVPGPVHVNLRARKPLEPLLARGEREETFAAHARELRRRPIPSADRPALVPSPSSLADVSTALARAERGLIVAGSASLESRAARESVASLARATGFPLLADATSQLRVASTGALASSDLLLSSSVLRDDPPDCVLQLGAAPVSSGWEALVASPRIRTHVVIAPHGWHDPASTATHLLPADLGLTCELLAELCALSPKRGDRRAWASRLAALDRSALLRIAAQLEDGRFSEPAVARACLDESPANALVVVGNSLPIRTIEAWGGHLPEGLGLLSQRGANGIDGLVSSAAGAAATGRPTLLLVGDVSAVHDLGGLAVAARAGAPLAIVVVDNGGGRIFEQLPVARAGLSAAELAHFTTPHDVSFEAAAQAFGVPYVRPPSLAALRSSLRAAFARTGATVVHAVVAPHEAVELRAALQREVDAAGLAS